MGSIPITRSSSVRMMTGRRFIIGVLLTVAPTAASLAADFSAYAVLTTDYVWRGVTQSDGHGAAQLGVDVSFENGIYAGIWGSTVDINSAPGRQRDVQANYYVGYTKDAGKRWNLGASIVAYSYPGAEGTTDYDYVEYSATVNLDDQYWLEYAYSPDVFNTGWEYHNFELYGEWHIVEELSLSAGFGHYDVSRLGADDYDYWHIGITRPFGRIDVDLRFHDTNGWIPAISSPESADSRFSLSARFVF